MSCTAPLNIVRNLQTEKLCKLKVTLYLSKAASFSKSLSVLALPNTCIPSLY